MANRFQSKFDKFFQSIMKDLAVSVRDALDKMYDNVTIRRNESVGEFGSAITFMIEEEGEDTLFVKVSTYFEDNILMSVSFEQDRYYDSRKKKYTFNEFLYHGEKNLASNIASAVLSMEVAYQKQSR